MGIAGAILSAAAITGVAGVVGSSLASGAQQSAANTSANTQLNIYGQNKDLLSPYVTGGQGAYSTLNNLLGVGGNSQIMQDTLNNLPGYQFTLNQGLKSVQNGVTARGLGVSGAALKGGAQYATGLAQSGYGGYAGLLQNSANTGMQAGSSIAGVGQATGASVGSSQIAAGNAAASGYLGATNAVSNAANSVPGNLLLAQYLGGSGGGNFDQSLAGQSSGAAFGYT